MQEYYDEPLQFLPEYRSSQLQIKDLVSKMNNNVKEYIESWIFCGESSTNIPRMVLCKDLDYTIPTSNRSCNSISLKDSRLGKCV